MPVKHCCHGTCNSDSRYVNSREDLKDVRFFPFPKPKTQLEKCTKWVKLCGRKGFDTSSIRKETYICSLHFIDGEPTEANPDPRPAVMTVLEKRNSNTKAKRKAPLQRPSPKKMKTPNEMEKVTIHLDHDYCTMQDENMEPTEYISEGTSDNIEDTAHQSTYTQTTTVRCDVSTQTNLAFDELSNYSDSELKDPASMRRNFFMNIVFQSNKSLKFYTGITLPIFNLLLMTLESKASKLTYWSGNDTQEEKMRTYTRKLNIKQELTMVLLRLRRGFDVEVIGNLFNVNQSTATSIIITWINFV